MISEPLNAAQLTLDGREEPIGRRMTRPALSGVQRQILRSLANRELTSTEAGRIVLPHRDPPCGRCGQGRCGFTSTDGSDVLKRLAARGLVRRIAAGRWRATR